MLVGRETKMTLDRLLILLAVLPAPVWGTVLIAGTALVLFARGFFAELGAEAARRLCARIIDGPSARDVTPQDTRLKQ